MKCTSSFEFSNLREATNYGSFPTASVAGSRPSGPLGICQGNLWTDAGSGSHLGEQSMFPSDFERLTRAAIRRIHGGREPSSVTTRFLPVHSLDHRLRPPCCQGKRPPNPAPRP